jgi:protein-ribulosamine 3-kinase
METMAEPGPEVLAASVRAAFLSGRSGTGVAASGGKNRRIETPAILAMETLGGGSDNRFARLRTDGGDFFCKWNRKAPCDMFPREKQGLLALASAVREKGLLKIPVVAGVCPGDAGETPGGETPGFVPLIVMEYLPAGIPTGETWERLGRGLAEMHRQSGDRFGFAADNYCGPTPQANNWEDDWAGFYARRRIGAMASRLRAAGALSESQSRACDDFVSRLPALLDHKPAPSLIHGDLWSGNIVCAPGGPALVDPAAYYADREAELGMMTLFGGFPRRVYDAYGEAWPLPPGWRERLPIYQVYHLLNHWLLFGGSYAERTIAAIRRFI